jgi:GNAT superfamily N-acetyltransferase
MAPGRQSRPESGSHPYSWQCVNPVPARAGCRSRAFFALDRALEPSSGWIAEIARKQFDQWGPLTDYPSVCAYQAFLLQAAGSQRLPRTLVAVSSGVLLGSVNLLAGERAIRSNLTPWLGQLFVMAAARGKGVGGALVDAAAAYARRQGHGQLFLFTTGTLPDYYRRRGWVNVDHVVYLGRVRTIMRRDLQQAPERG